MAADGADIAAGGEDGSVTDDNEELWQEYLAQLKAEEDKNRMRTEEGLNLLHEKRVKEEKEANSILNRMRVHRAQSFGKDQVGMELERSDERALTGVIEQLRVTMLASATDWRALFRASSQVTLDDDGNQGIALPEFERVLRESVSYFARTLCRKQTLNVQQRGNQAHV